MQDCVPLSPPILKLLATSTRPTFPKWENQHVRINFRCKICGKAYSVKAQLAGKSAKCGCGEKLVIPSAAASLTPALSRTFSTELVLPPDSAKPEPPDDEYEIEPPVERPVPETIRRAVKVAESSGPPVGAANPPRAVDRSLPAAGGQSRIGKFFLASILLVILAALVGLWAGSSVVNSVNAFSTAYRTLPIPQSLHAGRISSERAQVDQAIGAFELARKINLLLPAIAFIAYLVWIYRAHSRLKEMRATNLRFTPGWAVGYQFVPVWNLIRPYQIMREIWHGSDPGGDSFNDCSRRQVHSSWLLRFWWAAALMGGVACSLMLFKEIDAMRMLPSQPNLLQAAQAAIRPVRFQQVGLLFVIAYYVLLGLVVWSIERRQSARLGIVNSLGAK
jgi:hypothetical protein